MARAGAVWVDVLPNMATFATSVRTGARINLSSFGASSGREFSQAMTSSARSGMAGFGAEVRGSADRAAAAVTVASAKVASARDREAKAAGTVRVAELRLNELRATGRASAASLAAAEERLATAVRGSATSTTGAVTAARQLEVAQARAGRAAAGAAVETQTGMTRMGGIAQTGLGKVSSGIGSVLKQGSGLGVMFAGFAAADFLGHAVKNAGDFQKEMNVLVTAGGEAQSNIKGIQSGIESIATDTGTSLTNLSEGAYTIEKAGIRGADALKVLRAASEGAKDENVQLSIMTNALTSIMTSYHLPASAAVQTTNELIAASGAAKTTMSNFAGSLSTVLPVASAAGISFAQVGGAIATLTNHGTSADEATQELSNTIRNLSAPNHVAVQEMSQFGLSSVDVSTKLGKRGLTGTLELLSQTVLQRMGPSGTVLLNTFNTSKVAAQDADTMFQHLPASIQKTAQSYKDGTISIGDWHKVVKGLPADQAPLATSWAIMQNKAQGFNTEIRSGNSQAQTYTEAIKKMTGGANGLNTTLQLTGENTGRFNANVAAVGLASKGAGDHVAAWATVQKSLNVQTDRLAQSVDVAGVKIGTALIPALTGIAQGAATALTGTTNFISRYADVFKPATAAVGTFALTYAGLQGAVKLGSGALQAGSRFMDMFRTATRGATAAEESLNVATKLNPIGLIAGAAALAVGGLMAWHDNTVKQRQAVDDLTSAIEADNGAIGANAKLAVAKGLVDSGVLDKYKALGFSVDTVTSAYLGNDQALASVSGGLTKFVTAAGTGATFNGQYGTVTTTVTDKMREQGRAAGELSQSLSGGNANLDAARSKASNWGQALKGAGLNADGTAKAVWKVGAAAKSTNAPLGAAVTKTNALDVANKALATDVGNLTGALSNLSSQYFGIAQSDDKFRGSLNAIGQAAKNSKLGIKGNSDEAIAYRSAIESSVQSVADFVAAEVKQGLSGSRISKDFKNRRQALIDELNQMGLSKQQIGYYTKALDGIPGAVKTNVTLPQIAQRQAEMKHQNDLYAAAPEFVSTKVSAPNLLQTTAQTKKLNDGLFGLPRLTEAKVTAPGATTATGQVKDLHTAAGKLPTKIGIDIALATNAKAVYQQLLTLGPNVAINAQKLKNQKQTLLFADGGPIIGAGGPRDDQVPLWGSHGEYMINAKSTAKHRPLVEAINRDTLPRYADGGPVAGWPQTRWSAATSPLGMLGAGSAYSPLVATVPPKAWADVAAQAGAALQAAQAAAAAAGATGGKYSGPVPTGGAVTRWAPLVLSVLAELGLSGGLVPKVLRQIQTESGGNPNATQGAIGDVNNRSGDLAKGLMQVIGATFNAYAGPYRAAGQYNPHASIYAGLNYAKHRYGPGLSFLGQGHGYDGGGRLEHGGVGVNLSGHPEQVLNPVQERAFTAAMDRVGSPSPVATADRVTAPVLNARIFIGDVELKDIVRVEIDADHEAHATLLGYGTG